MPGGRRSRSRQVRLRAGAALAALVLVLVAVGVALATSGSDSPQRRSASRRAAPANGSVPGVPTPTAKSAATATAAPGKLKPRPRARRAVKTRIRILRIRITDAHRTMLTPQGRVPRAFTIIIRIPVGPRGPFGLIVFGHGYAVSPAPYVPLLQDWARAGFVVASPVFPLENSGAPGGPNENDLPNQPRDMSLVIDRMISGSFSHLIRHDRIAVAGQSDGGDTALAVAYDPRVRDSRVAAAVVLSGAEDPFISRFSIAPEHVPLLATQGTADTINPAWMTHQFYDPASPHKFLLELVGAGHLPPYTQPGVTLNTVARGTTAFLHCYLLGSCARFEHFRVRGTSGTPSVLTGR